MSGCFDPFEHQEWALFHAVEDLWYFIGMGFDNEYEELLLDAEIEVLLDAF